MVGLHSCFTPLIAKPGIAEQSFLTVLGWQEEQENRWKRFKDSFVRTLTTG
jgi:hypothetical protein